MGHLISIMNKIVDLCDTSFGQFLKDNLPDVAKSLDEFKETTLNETNKLQETLLVSTPITQSRFFYFVKKRKKDRNQWRRFGKGPCWNFFRYLILLIRKKETSLMLQSVEQCGKRKQRISAWSYHSANLNFATIKTK